jgi:hypothetical protein
LYPADNPAHSLLSSTGCKAFKLVQDKGRTKLITYYQSWADLDKVTNTKFNYEDFSGVWMRYFAPSLNRPRRSPKNNGPHHKQNQEVDSSVEQNKSSKQKQEGGFYAKRKTQQLAKAAVKDLDSTAKLTLLAEIKSLLNRIVN